MVAIRLRAVSRLQPQLTDDFEDTVLMIDPYDVANQINNATEDNFVGQMKVARSGGNYTRKMRMGARRFGRRGASLGAWERQSCAL